MKRIQFILLTVLWLATGVSSSAQSIFAMGDSRGHYYVVPDWTIESSATNRFGLRECFQYETASGEVIWGSGDTSKGVERRYTEIWIGSRAYAVALRRWVVALMAAGVAGGAVIVTALAWSGKMRRVRKSAPVVTPFPARREEDSFGVK